MKLELFNIAFEDFFNKWVIIKKLKSSKESLDFFNSITEKTTVADFIKFLNIEKIKYVKEFNEKYNKDVIIKFIDYLYSLYNNFDNIKQDIIQSVKKEDSVEYIKLLDINRFDYLYCQGLFSELLKEQNITEEKLLFPKNISNEELLEKYKEVFLEYAIKYDLGFEETDFSFVSKSSFVDPLCFPYKEYSLFLLFIKEIALTLGMKHLNEYYDYIEKNWVDSKTYFNHFDMFKEKTKRHYDILCNLIWKIENMFKSDNDFKKYIDLEIDLDTKATYSFYLLYYETQRYLQGFNYTLDIFIIPSFRDILYNTFSDRERAIEEKVIEENDKKHQEKMRVDKKYREDYLKREVKNKIKGGVSSFENVLTPDEKYDKYIENKKSLLKSVFGHK